jgi:hypothetical protein
MRAISRRLDRLEERLGIQLGPVVESLADRELRRRIAAARLRLAAANLPCGLPISPERRAELKGRSVCDILRDGRRREFERQRELEKTVP